MKKVYVSAIERVSYEIHRSPHHDDGEKAIELTEDEFVFVCRVKTEWKKVLKMVIEKYMEEEVHKK